jgi:peptidoglycan hydrolase-like protein with peptidoglycan-binding domain
VPTEDPAKTRRRIALGVIAAVLVVASGALAATARIESPQEALAKSQPPPPSVITATVRRAVLWETVTAQGQVSAGRTVSVDGAGAAPPGDDPVVTGMPGHVGDQVSAGQVLVEVSGRPIIALRGALPAYRDLMPGDSGPDVVQLQRALRDLRYDITDTPGLFGVSTQKAIAALYSHLGYSAPTTQPAQAVYLPKGEVDYVPSLPAHIASVNAGVGSPASGTVLALAETGLRVSGSVDPVNGSLLKAGMAVTLLLQGSTGQSVPGKVTSVGSLTVNANSGAFYPVTWSGLSPLPSSWAGQQVTVNARVRATRGSVLAVPSTAIYSTASGESYVLLESGGRQVQVPVSTGVSVGGMTQINGALEPGDKAIVGVAGQ